MDLASQPKLSATALHVMLDHAWDGEPFVVRVTRDPAQADPARHALLQEGDCETRPAGFAAYLVSDTLRKEHSAELEASWRVWTLPDELAYLQEGDVIRINPRSGELWVMYRRESLSNSILLTERCNSWCVMCSQPPKAKGDGALVSAWLDALPLVSPETMALGITGGEPTLLGDQFFEIVQRCLDHLPATGLHILTNGRLFNYLALAQKLADIRHPDLVLGIPLYSDIAWRHDFIVQADSAFDQTVRGLLNLARCGVRIEIRIVIHRYSVERLPQLCQFIARNLPFVEHVALMGLEPIGFAKHNLDSLWVDPVDYSSDLTQAVAFLDTQRMAVSIYNHQLCVLPAALWPFARKSISDWKNIYLPVCGRCTVQSECGGFFHSAANAHSRGIKPLGRGTAPLPVS